MVKSPYNWIKTLLNCILPLFFTALPLTNCSEEIPILYKMEGNSIVSYTLPASMNKGLPADIKGTINGGRIELVIPYIHDISALVPEIIIQGKSVSPASGDPVDFSKGSVTYTVTAYDRSKKDYVVSLIRTGNSLKDIESFCFYQADNPSLLDKNYCGTIDDPDPWNPLDLKNPENETVYFVLPNTDYSGKFNDGITDTAHLMLKPRVVTSGAEVIPSCDEAVDFAFSKYAPVIYTVKARDGSEKQYSVIVDHARNNEKQIINFWVAGAIQSEIDHDALTINVKVDPDVTGDIIFPSITISPEATISPDPGTPIIFGQDETVVSMDYDVTAEDLTVNRYTVTIAKKLNENEIESFVFAAADNPGLAVNIPANTIDTENAEVIVYVPHGTNLNGLIPTITISPSALEIFPASGVAQDFRVPVTYTVTAENDEIKEWSVFVYEEPDTSCEIITFDLLASQNSELDHDYIGTIDTDSGTVKFYDGYPVEAEVPYHIDITSLTPVITISGVSITPPVGESQDFSSPIIYTVTAESGDSKDYTVTLNRADPSTENTMYAFNFLATENTALDADVIGVYIPATDTFELTVPYDKLTETTLFVPDIVISDYATVAPEDGVEVDFSGPVSYTVTAQDGTSTRVCTVEVIEAPPSSEKEIETFRFLASENTPDINSDIYGSINQGTPPYDTDPATIHLIVPYGTDVTALVPDIAVSEYASVNPSDGTPVDFTNPVDYIVTAQDDTTKTYTVSVEIQVRVELALYPNGINGCENWLSRYPGTLPNNYSAVNDASDSTYVYKGATGGSDDQYEIEDSGTPDGVIEKVDVFYRLSRTGPGVTAKVELKISGIEYKPVTVGDSEIPLTPSWNDFSYTWEQNPYTSAAWTWSDIDNLRIGIDVTSSGSEIRCSEMYAIVYYAPEISGDNEIISFNFLDSENPALDTDVTGNVGENTVSLVVPAGTDVTALVPDISIPQFAAINPEDGIPQDFSDPDNPVVYVVTAQDGTQRVYYVTVTAIDLLRPDSPGDETNVYGQTPSSGLHWEKVDDDGSHDGDTTKVHTEWASNASYRDLYNIESPSAGSGNIHRVKVYWVIKNFSSNSNAKGAVKTGGTVYETANLNPSSDGSWHTYSHTWNDNPSTMTEWTWADIGSLQAGIVLIKNNADVNCTQVYVEVHYTPGSEKNIVAFDFLMTNNPGLSFDVYGTINTDEVSLVVPAGVDFSALVPDIIVSPSATISPESGTPNDFTGPAIYTVTAADSSIKDYTVTVAAYEVLRPENTGDETNITNQTANPHWAQIDDPGANDGDSSRVHTEWASNGTYRDLYLIQDPTVTEGTITGVRVYWALRVSSTTSNAKGAIKTGGAVYETSEFNPTTSYAIYSHTWDVNPGSGLEWTWTEINNLQAGVSLIKDGGSDSHCSQVYIEINYLP